mgnify:CR=1 FL=1
MKNYFITILARFVFFLCLGLSKWKISGERHLDDLVKSKKPILLCVWHGRFLFGAYYMLKKKYPVYAIAGRHNDAEMIARVFKGWGFGLIRGSSTRGGENVINELKNKFIDGKTVCITSDGPRGPVHVAKNGSIRIGMECGAAIVPMTGISNRYWKFKSWDKFILPKPFSTIYLTIGRKIEYDIKNAGDKEGAQVVTERLNKLQTKGDSRVS